MRLIKKRENKWDKAREKMRQSERKKIKWRDIEKCEKGV